MKTIILTDDEFFALYDDLGVEFIVHDDDEMELLAEHNKALASAYTKLKEKHEEDG